MSLGRTNEEWVTAFRESGGRADDPALVELRDYLRGALGKALRGSTRVSDDELDDFAQDALLKVMSSIDSFRGDSRFTTWATAIAIRVGYTVVRRRRSAHVPIENVDESLVQWQRSQPTSADVNLELSDVLGALRKAVVGDLTERQRTVILAEMQGVSSERTAELLGTNRNAVYKVYHDARVKLKRALNDAGHAPEEVKQLLEQLR